jgi:hypothetical protein
MADSAPDTQEVIGEVLSRMADFACDLTSLQASLTELRLALSKLRSAFA